MTESSLFNSVNVPLQSLEETFKTDDDLPPPPYQHPKIDFNSGWKDRIFSVIFLIHVIVVLIIAFFLGIPVHIDDIKHNPFQQIPSNFDLKPYFYGLGVAALAGILSSIMIFFFLQIFANRVIKCSFILIISIQVLLCVILGFVLWPLCFIPGTFLMFILIYLSCIRKRISFSEAHLSAGCAALRSHPSLILITIIMFIVEFLWFIVWFLMAIGIQNALNGSRSSISPNQFANLTTPMTDLNSNSSLIKDSRLSPEKWYENYVRNVIAFLLMFSWYWGSITFANIAHFVTACSVAHWWFPDESNKQYSTKISLKRSFTTNFGTICFGSFFEGLIKAIRSRAENNRDKGILSCVLLYFIKIIEKVIGYLNEWALIFSALTGKGFVESSKDFIELFRKRGWTVIINDSIVGATFAIINIAIGLISAIVACTFLYFITTPSTERIVAIVIFSCIAFLIGLFVSTIITTILTSCVRTIFVCFALNSSALGAKHPDHLQKLSKVWNEYYPEEFARMDSDHSTAQSTA